MSSNQYITRKWQIRTADRKEAFDDSKVLGTSIKNGNFKQSKLKTVPSIWNDLGDGANDDGEKNRWVSFQASSSLGCSMIFKV